MRSRAHFRSHPLHPMLIPFPFAFLVGGFAADVLGTLLESDDLHVVGWYALAAGIVMGLVAAVPGLVDYRATVPPASSARKRATKHMIVNVTAILLFALAWWLRGGPGVRPDLVLLAIQAVAAALLGAGGWMGGTLVYRNQIGVDHRYARAGRWKDERVEIAGGNPVVARVDELEVDQMKLLRVGDERIVLARTEDGFAAFADRCSHRGGSLAGGLLACGRVTCPWHGSQFDVRTGAAIAGPADEGIETYSLEVTRDEVRLRLP